MARVNTATGARMLCFAHLGYVLMIFVYRSFDRVFAARRYAMHDRPCHGAVSILLFCRSHSCILSKPVNITSNFFTSRNLIILVFHELLCLNSDYRNLCRSLHKIFSDMEARRAAFIRQLSFLFFIDDDFQFFSRTLARTVLSSIFAVFEGAFIVIEYFIQFTYSRQLIMFRGLGQII